jgi:phosphatidylglycerol:prolipoprotein diacylglycerol transferase
VFPLIPIAPDPTALDLGIFKIGWYGIGYVAALGALLFVTQFEAERRGIHRQHVWNALLIVGALALIGGRLYHVIDEFELYRDNLLAIVLPPYSGLGLYGGVAGAALGILIYTRWQKLPLRIGLDAVIPGTLFAQGIARWGNFFNQELYGPPTDLPWGIPIDCAHRVIQYACPPGSDPSLVLQQGFHPLFFYESSLDILGGFIALFISRRFLQRLKPGDLAAFWGIWYGSVRTLLETFREGWNWTVGGIPTAQLVGVTIVIIGVAWIAYNHRPGAKSFEWPEPVKPPPPPPDPFADEDSFDHDDTFEDGDPFDDEDAAEQEAAADPLPAEDDDEGRDTVGDRREHD